MSNVVCALHYPLHQIAQTDDHLRKRVPNFILFTARIDLHNQVSLGYFACHFRHITQVGAGFRLRLARHANFILALYQQSEFVVAAQFTLRKAA